MELDKQFANKQQQLENQAQMQQMSTLSAWLQKQQSVYTGEFSKVIMGKESFVKAMQNADSQLASQAIKAALQSLTSLETIQGRAKLSSAKTAAAEAWADAGNPIVCALAAAATFAAVIRLEKGGIVPCTGIGDIVPARLEPGEAVIPKQMTEMLSHAAKFCNGGDGGGWTCMSTISNISHSRD